MYWYDYRLVMRFMEWRKVRPPHVIESELLFQYHKLEKGLSMPGPARFFGALPCSLTMELITEWEISGGDLKSPTYIGAIETLRSYASAVKSRTKDEQSLRLLASVEVFLAKRISGSSPEVATPIPYQQVDPSTSKSFFDRLMLGRRSVRIFSDVIVPRASVEHAVRTAQFSPSACNRQPWRVHVFQDRAKIKSLLQFQNGNAGFGHQLNTLLIITSDMRSFFSASERHEPYVDGGLFSMSLILSLYSQGIASCCLNWCVSPEVDRAAHSVAGIPPQERIIMYLAVGYPADNIVVPLSPRKSNVDVTVWH